jgi:hypothetical protein
MSDLNARINALPQEQVFEAMRILGATAFEDDIDSTKATNALAPLTDEPYQNIAELEQLARMALVAAALDPMYRSEVEQTLEGLAQKQIILGGAEIVALSIVALGALQVIITRGKTGHTKKTTITDSQIVIEETTTFGLSGNLAGIFKSFFAPGT